MRWTIAFVMAVMTLTVVPGPRGAAGDQTAPEVRKAFDAWADAVSRADKRAYLAAFWKSPTLIVRVAGGDYRGFEAYRARMEGAELPGGGRLADFKNVHVAPLGRDAAVVAYERQAPASMTGGASVLFVGTLVYTRTLEGWKIAAWHAHSTRGRAPGSPH